jgi:PTS system N-acetylgalactosamine-specific IIA component
MSENESSGPRLKPRAIVAGHGDFAAGLVSAVQQITGRGNMFRTISARDLSASDLEALLRRSIEETGVSVVFTDLQAGSCTMATRRYLKDRGDVLLVAGVNLPMLLDFVMADQLPPVQAAQHALDRGRAAIGAMGGLPRKGGGASGGAGSAA